MSSDAAKGVIKTSKVSIAISAQADLGDLILVVQETIKLQRAGYALKDDPFTVLFGKTLEFSKEESEVGGSDEVLGRSIETLELTVRTYNCLKNDNIKTIGRLVEKTEAELLKSKNFGRKSLNEIKELLSELGLSLKY